MARLNDTISSSNRTACLGLFPWLAWPTDLADWHRLSVGQADPAQGVGVGGRGHEGHTLVPCALAGQVGLVAAVHVLTEKSTQEQDRSDAGLRALAGQVGQVRVVRIETEKERRGGT